MLLRSLYLQHFRSYENKKFDLSDVFTIIVGPNTAGKTNLSEGIYLLLTGKSFRTSTDADMIAFGHDMGRVQGLLVEESEVKNEDNEPEKTKVEIVLSSNQGTRFSKKYFINGVTKSRKAFYGLLPVVLFRPEELEIITDGPSLRRAFLDSVLEQVDKDYASAKITYERALRQRNALLRMVQETGKRNVEQFAYWDNLLIINGQLLTKKREDFLAFINTSSHEIFSLQTTYDKSIMSRDRLDQYRDAEVSAGVTLVGPHRDDFFVTFQVDKEQKDIRHFGSRGQSRLAVLQLKMLQIAYLEQMTEQKPVLVLDDIFSELDAGHIQLVLEKVKGSQVILTTTHREFIPDSLTSRATVIELEDRSQK